MDKYRRVEKAKAHDALPVEANEIRITQQGNVRSYISYANGLFVDKNERGVVLKAMGNAISKAVTVAEILKHRIEGLHQITQISSIETVDVYEPLEEGLDRIETKRHIPSIAIQLSLDALSKDDPGYQSPIPSELVSKVFDDREPRKAVSAAAAARKAAKRSEKKKSKAAASASPQPDGDAAADQENAKSRANAPPTDAAAAPASPQKVGGDSAPVEGKAARNESAKRGRNKSGRKPRGDTKSVPGAHTDGESPEPSNELKPAPSSGGNDPGAATAPTKASRSRKPRGKRTVTNSDASGQQAAAHGESAHAGSLRGQGRGRSGWRSSRGRDQGGRDGGASVDAPVPPRVAPTSE